MEGQVRRRYSGIASIPSYRTRPWRYHFVDSKVSFLLIPSPESMHLLLFGEGCEDSGSIRSRDACILSGVYGVNAPVSFVSRVLMRLVFVGLVLRAYVLYRRWLYPRVIRPVPFITTAGRHVHQAFQATSSSLEGRLKSDNISLTTFPFVSMSPWWSCHVDSTMTMLSGYPWYVSGLAAPSLPFLSSVPISSSVPLPASMSRDLATSSAHPPQPLTSAQPVGLPGWPEVRARGR